MDLSEYDYFIFVSNSLSYNFFLKNKDLERYLFIEACGKIVDYVHCLCTFAHGGPEVGVRSLGIRVTGCCELLDVGARN